MNSISLVGVLASDVKLTETRNGASVGKFNIAVNRPYQTNGEKKADFIPISCFGKVAENCAKYLSKGCKVAVVGSLKVDSTKDNEGNWHTYFSVESGSIEFLSGKKNADGDSERDKYDENGEPRDNGYENNANKQMTAEDYYRKRSYVEYKDDGDLPF